jgi:hypothetical protein
MGVNLTNLNKLMKTVDNSDTLSFYLENSDLNRLAIKVENSEKDAHRVQVEHAGDRAVALGHS